METSKSFSFFQFTYLCITWSVYITLMCIYNNMNIETPSCLKVGLGAAVAVKIHSSQCRTLVCSFVSALWNFSTVNDYINVLRFPLFLLLPKGTRNQGSPLYSLYKSSFSLHINISAWANSRISFKNSLRKCFDGLNSSPSELVSGLSLSVVSLRKGIELSQML